MEWRQKLRVVINDGVNAMLDDSQNVRHHLMDEVGKGQTTLLRMDIELDANDDPFIDELLTGSQLYNEMYKDLFELIWFGNVNPSRDEPRDPWLMSFDGIVKRGKEPVDLGIPVIQYYMKRKGDKKEYTIHFSLWIKWEE